MSFVHLTIIKNNTVYQLYVHYRTALRLLEQDTKDILPLLKGKYCDAGYLIVDYDKKQIVNGQDAFVIRQKKEFDVIDV